ncbi:hypothetical protein DFS34DRAFT_590879 [Phlyctochytrium arcticum]|nr:hypothetical protein DFS34DRAFT_590879 [Phlyctochytrium arcticum]
MATPEKARKLQQARSKLEKFRATRQKLQERDAHPPPPPQRHEPSEGIIEHQALPEQTAKLPTRDIGWVETTTFTPPVSVTAATTRVPTLEPLIPSGSDRRSNNSDKSRIPPNDTHLGDALPSGSDHERSNHSGSSWIPRSNTTHVAGVSPDLTSPISPRIPAVIDAPQVPSVVEAITKCESSFHIPSSSPDPAVTPDTITPDHDAQARLQSLVCLLQKRSHQMSAKIDHSERDKLRLNQEVEALKRQNFALTRQLHASQVALVAMADMTERQKRDSNHLKAELEQQEIHSSNLKRALQETEQRHTRFCDIISHTVSRNPEQMADSKTPLEQDRLIKVLRSLVSELGSLRNSLDEAHTIIDAQHSKIESLYEGAAPTMTEGQGVQSSPSEPRTFTKETLDDSQVPNTKIPKDVHYVNDLERQVHELKNMVVLLTVGVDAAGSSDTGLRVDPSS